MIRILAVLTIFLFAGLNAPAAAEAVRVRAAAHEPPGKEAYGRIVFEWPSVVDYKAVVESGKLVVRFAEPFEGRLDVVTRYLGDYVAGASVEDQGRTLSFPLKSSLRLKSYADGTTVVLDLTRAAAVPAKAGAPRAPVKPASVKPEAAPAAAAGAPVLPVRAGDHEGFGRLVFDWTRNVDYAVAHDGTRATIRFSQPAKLDVVSLKERLPKTITAAETGTDGGGLTVNFTITDNGRVRHFRSGTRVVFDVLDPAGAARSTAPRPQDGAAQAGEWKPTVPPKQAAAVAPQPVSTAQPVASAVAAAATTTLTAPPAAKPAPSTLPDAKQSAPAAAPPANLLARQPSELRTLAADKAAAAADPSLDEVLAAIPGMMPVRAPAPSATSAATQAASAPPATPRAAAASATAAETPAKQRSIAPASGQVVVQPLGTVNDLTGLRLSLPVDAGGAVYERSGYLWVMLDRRAVVELAGVWPRNAPKPQLVSTAATPEITLLRWRLPDDKHPGLRRDGNDWMVELLGAMPPPPTDIKPETHLASAAGPRLLLRGYSFGAVRELRDPEVGDRIWVVPMAVAGYGTARERRFAELQLVATLQGLVISPSTDGIVVRNVTEGVEITMPGGLHLSGNVAQVSSTRKPESPSGAKAGSGQTPIPALATRSDRLFDFDVWGAGRRSFFDRKRELQRTVIDAPGTAQNAARLALAQFFFAHGYASDTLGILQVIEEDDAAAAKDPSFRALRGASRYLAGDYAAAGPDLFDGSLDVERETALWRGALLASQNDWIAASRYFGQADKALRTYPTELRLRFGLLAAEAAFMIGDSGLAKFQLDSLARMNPPRPWMDQIDYLQGKVLEKAYDIDAASAAWGRAMAGVHRPSKVKARLARTELLLRAKRMTPTEAIAELEGLRFGWRGDDIELAVLKRLGDLYIEVADYRNGLQTLREAVTYFPKSNDAAAIDEKMRAAFAALYIGDEADKLSPLAALSLHDDFHDLAPAGEAGDVIASKLVDRLVGVELLDRASEVLKQQVETRLKGAALAEGVNRLGLIHLLARQPEEAVAVLNGRMPPEATPTAVAQRRQLRARALGELTRYKEAIALLEGDNSQDADRLRAEIGWRTQNWPLAAYAFARLVPEASKTLSDTDRQTVLRLAIAQALKNDSGALKDLRKVYGPGMAQSAFKESFDLVTAPGEGPAVDLRAITRQVAEVDQFRAFMSSYRDKLLTRRDNAAKPVTSAAPRSGAQTAATN